MGKNVIEKYTEEVCKSTGCCISSCISNYNLLLEGKLCILKGYKIGFSFFLFFFFFGFSFLKTVISLSLETVFIFPIPKYSQVSSLNDIWEQGSY